MNDKDSTVATNGDTRPRSLDEYVPVELFGRDHWSTLGYIGTILVECAGFQVGYDPRMRQGRRNFRVMREECRKPKRVTQSDIGSLGLPMDLKYSTVLADGSFVSGHDDWSCVQDMAEAGFFSLDSEGGSEACAADIEPRVVLHLSQRGKVVLNALHAHKRKGGTWATFCGACNEECKQHKITKTVPA